MGHPRLNMDIAAVREPARQGGRGRPWLETRRRRPRRRCLLIGGRHPIRVRLGVDVEENHPRGEMAHEVDEETPDEVYLERSSEPLGGHEDRPRGWNEPDPGPVEDGSRDMTVAWPRGDRSLAQLDDPWHVDREPRCLRLADAKTLGLEPFAQGYDRPARMTPEKADKRPVEEQRTYGSSRIGEVEELAGVGVDALPESHRRAIVEAPVGTASLARATMEVAQRRPRNPLEDRRDTP